MAFLRGRVGDEGGFTILESTVALVIIFGVLLTLLRTLDSGIKVLVESRRQAAASTLANELLERARSLEWEHTGLTDASNDAECPADPPSDGVDGVACVDWSGQLGVATDADGEYTFEGDKIVFLNENETFDPFLSFHQQITRDQTVFDRYLFVTTIRNDPTDAATERWRKLTAIVEWIPPSGFRKEVRQVTYVARFAEPSQPFLQGSVILDGGSLTISGMVQGTSDFADPLAARPELVSATFEFPDAQVDALTDYVSGAAVLAGGMVGDVEWADGVSTLQTATLAASGLARYEKRADDDFGSAPPLDDPSDGRKSFNAWSLCDAPPHDLCFDEENDAQSALDAVEVEGQAWTEHNPGGANPKVDGLPYSRLIDMDSAEMVLPGYFFEYEESLQDLLGINLAESDYVFAFMSAGHDSGPLLQYSGSVDRFETSLSARRVDLSFDWNAERIYLGRDTAYDAVLGVGVFQGWVRIDLPRVRGTLSAGEAAAARTWGESGDVVISYWKPSSAAYVELLRKDYDSLVGGAPLSVDIDASPGNGVFTDPPLEHTLTDPSRPELRYQVRAALTVNPPLESETLDSLGDRAEVILQAPSLVTGTMEYHVEDLDPDFGQVLFDVDLAFSLGGVEATARYINPEAL